MVKQKVLLNSANSISDITDIMYENILEMLSMELEDSRYEFEVMVESATQFVVTVDGIDYDCTVDWEPLERGKLAVPVEVMHSGGYDQETIPMSVIKPVKRSAKHFANKVADLHEHLTTRPTI